MLLLVGDALIKLKELESDSIQSCVTSPPYFGLRDYGTGQWERGDPACEHSVGSQVADSKYPNAIQTGQRPGVDSSHCKKCGATRVDLQIGLEQSPKDYISKLVEVFRGVRRVLHPSGTLWVVIGDSYFGGARGCQDLKPKDLIGIPWILAFALRADGWYLRSDIVWEKLNCMPESVTDRPTRSHEYIFLLTKQARYFYDAVAIREPAASANPDDPSYRSKRSVWNINPRPYLGAHFATFPEELPSICIRAGTSEKGCCPTCKAPWARILDKAALEPVDYEGKWSNTEEQSSGRRMLANARARRMAGEPHDNPFPAPVTLGWKPTCKCPAHEPIPCTVLDPFAGSGTTLAVATELRRDFVGIELNPEYLKLIEQRLEGPLREEAMRKSFDEAMAYADSLPSEY